MTIKRSQKRSIPPHQRSAKHGLTEVTALGVGEREERPPGVVGEWLPEPAKENASFAENKYKRPS